MKPRTFKRIIIACLIISTFLIISTSVLVAIEKENATLPIPSYDDMIRSIQNFEFPDPSYRFPAEGIANYKISQQNNWSAKTSKLSDYALHRLITSNLLDYNPQHLRIFDDKQFLRIARQYNPISSRFIRVAVRNDAINLIKKYYPDDSSLDSKSDAELFKRIIG